MTLDNLPSRSPSVGSTPLSASPSPPPSSLPQTAVQTEDQTLIPISSILERLKEDGYAQPTFHIPVGVNRWESTDPIYLWRSEIGPLPEGIYKGKWPSSNTDESSVVLSARIDGEDYRHEGGPVGPGGGASDSIQIRKGVSLWNTILRCGYLRDPTTTDLGDRVRFEKQEIHFRDPGGRLYETYPKATVVEGNSEVKSDVEGTKLRLLPGTAAVRYSIEGCVFKPIKGAGSAEPLGPLASA